MEEVVKIEQWQSSRHEFLMRNTVLRVAMGNGTRESESSRVYESNVKQALQYTQMNAVKICDADWHTKPCHWCWSGHASPSLSPVVGCGLDPLRKMETN